MADKEFEPLKNNLLLYLCNAISNMDIEYNIEGFRTIKIIIGDTINDIEEIDFLSVVIPIEAYFTNYNLLTEKHKEYVEKVKRIGIIENIDILVLYKGDAERIKFSIDISAEKNYWEIK